MGKRINAFKSSSGTLKVPFLTIDILFEDS